MFMLYSEGIYFVKPSKLMEEKHRAKLWVDLKNLQEDTFDFFTVTFLFYSFRRQYQPLSLNRLQYLIDLGRVDPTQPIDLTQLVNGRGVTIQPLKRDYGVQLVEEVSLG